MSPRPSPRRPRTTAAALALVAATLGGCASGSEPSPPSGVDGLTIPLQDPRAADFVDVVDNAWLPLVPGAVWTFGDVPSTSILAFRGSVHDGIATTILTTVGRDAAGLVVASGPSDHLAQDRDGNVWWMGRKDAGAAEVTWFDEPALYLPAVPRRGDGWSMADEPGLQARAQVVDDGEDVEVPAGEYDDAIVVEVVENGLTRRLTLVRGVGPVQNDEAGLVAHDEPRS